MLSHLFVFLQTLLILSLRLPLHFFLILNFIFFYYLLKQVCAWYQIIKCVEPYEFVFFGRSDENVIAGCGFEEEGVAPGSGLRAFPLHIGILLNISKHDLFGRALLVFLFVYGEPRIFKINDQVPFRKYAHVEKLHLLLLLLEGAFQSLVLELKRVSSRVVPLH